MQENETTIENTFLSDFGDAMNSIVAAESSVGKTLGIKSDMLWDLEKHSDVNYLLTCLEELFDHAAEHFPRSAPVMFNKDIFNVRMAEKDFRNKDIEKAKPYFDQGIKDLIDCAMVTTVYKGGFGKWCLPELMVSTLDTINKRKEYGDLEEWGRNFIVSPHTMLLTMNPTGSKDEEMIAKGQYCQGLIKFALDDMDFAEKYIKNFLKWKYFSLRRLYDKEKIHIQGRSKSTLLPHELFGRNIREYICKEFLNMEKSDVYHKEDHDENKYAEVFAIKIFNYMRMGL